MKCISFTAIRDRCLTRSFGSAGLKSTTTTLHDGDTTIHCWIPKTHNPNKPNLILIHGVGANCKWQWDTIINWVTRDYNVYVPDLLFFGESYTSRSDRTEQFQAECVMRALEGVGLIGKLNLVGLSYGGFVGYSMAARFPDEVERVVIVGSGVTLDAEMDVNDGLFSSKNIKDATNIILAQTPEMTKELLRITFYKPPNTNLVPSCLIRDYIHEMNVDYFEEKKEIIEAVQKDRRFSELPKITQLVVLNKTGHAINAEQPKELFRLIVSFAIHKS